MRHRSRNLVRTTVLGLLVLALVPAASLAQTQYSRRAGLTVGLGGSPDNSPDTGLDNFSWQGLFAMEIDSNTLWGVRLGQLELDTDGAAGGDLTYITVSGQYVFPESFYESGLFLGLGLYDFSGDGGLFSGDRRLEDDSGVGVGLGVTGDFRLTDRLSFLVEISGHYADLDAFDFFVLGHFGVVYHF